MQTLGKQRGLWIGVAVSFVVGLLFGWMILGWMVAPVQWVNADPSDLRVSAKEAFVVMAADSFALNDNTQLAKERLSTFDQDELSAMLGRLREAAPDAESRERLDRLAEAVQVSPTTVEKPPVGTTKPSEQGSSGSSLRLIGLLALLIVLGWGSYVAFQKLQAKDVKVGRGFMRGAPTLKERISRTSTEESATETTPTLSFRREPSAPPADSLGQFATTYKLGDDGYDTSFTIEMPAGEFLGECGVGISEILDEGPPQKVTAFELWLFDKNDIRTVTKVLMSEHAYNDPDLMTKLKPKGDIVIAQPGELLILETATLRVQAQIAEMDYGWEGSLPPRSYFEHLVVEMTPMPKESSPEPTAPTLSAA